MKRLLLLFTALSLLFIGCQNPAGDDTNYNSTVVLKDNTGESKTTPTEEPQQTPTTEEPTTPTEPQTPVDEPVVEEPVVDDGLTIIQRIARDRAYKDFLDSNGNTYCLPAAENTKFVITWYQCHDFSPDYMIKYFPEEERKVLEGYRFLQVESRSFYYSDNSPCVYGVRMPKRYDGEQNTICAGSATGSFCGTELESFEKFMIHEMGHALARAEERKETGKEKEDSHGERWAKKVRAELTYISPDDNALVVNMYNKIMENYPKHLNKEY